MWALAIAIVTLLLVITLVSIQAAGVWPAPASLGATGPTGPAGSKGDTGATGAAGSNASALKTYSSHTGAFTVTTAQNNNTFLLNAAGGAITLPTVNAAGVAGCTFRFTVLVDVTTAWNIATQSAMCGVITQGPTETTITNLTVTADKTAVNFTTTAKKGDWLEIACDGTRFWVSGTSLAAAGVSTTG